VLELPSSSVNVCSVVSLFVTVSVTVPGVNVTVAGLNAKFCATIVAVDPPLEVTGGVVPPAVVAVVAVVAVPGLLGVPPEPPPLEQAAPTNAIAIASANAVPYLFFMSLPPSHVQS
jgi:hypothetical protein